MNLLALALAAALGSSPGSRPVREPLASESYVLDNGLTVVLHRDRSVPLIAVRVLYRVGMMDDPAGKRGMVHLLEHALFHDAEHLAGPIRAEFSRMVAIHQNGSTGPDFMQLHALVPAPNLEAALRLEAERMGFSVLDTARIGKERLIVLREIAERTQRDSWGDAMRTVHARLYDESHPLHPPSDATIANVSVPDLEALADRVLTPNNAVLVLAGNLPTTTEDLVLRYFSTLPSKDPERATAPVPGPLAAEVRVGIDGGVDPTPRVLIGWHAPARDHGSSPAGTLTASILRRRFQRRIASRGRRSLHATSSFAMYRKGRSHGQFFLGAVGGMGTAPSALVEELDATLASLVSDPPAERELQAARKRVAVAVGRQLDALEMRAEVLAESAAIGRRDIVAEDLTTLQTVTSEDVVRFAAQFLIEPPGRVVVMQSPREGLR